MGEYCERCEGCGEWVPEADMKNFNGGEYCDGCSITCDACGKEAPSDGDAWCDGDIYCAECVKQKLTRCPGCNDYELRGEMAEKIEGARCRKCAHAIEAGLLAIANATTESSEPHG